MPKLVIRNNQLSSSESRCVKLQDGTSVIDALIDHIPQGIDKEKTQIFINTEKLDTDEGEPKDLLRQVFNNDVIVVIQEVKGVDPLTIAYAVVVAVVAAAVAIALTPDPEIPNDIGERKESPNNQFSGQSNIARVYQSWPQILGRVVSYPDLVGQPIIEYDNNVQKIKQYFCVGFSDIQIENLRIGESPIGNFIGSVYDVHQPVGGSTVLADYVASFKSREIEGQILKGINEADPAEQYAVSISTSKTSFSFYNQAQIYLIKGAGSDQLFTDYYASPANFVVSFNYSYEFVESGLPEPAVGSGNGSISSFTDMGSYYEIIINPFSGEQVPDMDSIFNFVRQGGTQVGPISTSVKCEELWFNFSFPRGLKSDVDIEIIVEELDAKNGNTTGFAYTYTNTFTNSTLDPQYRTVKLDNELNGESWYRYSISRTNNATDDAATPDEVRAESVQAIKRFDSFDFGNRTLLEVELSAQGGIGTSNNTKVNCDATCKVRTYENGAVTSTYKASRKFADAVLFTYNDYFARDIEELNLESLYAIQEKIDSDNPELGYFDFTFDDTDINLQQRLETICNAARVSVFLSDGQWQFVRDEKRDFPVGVINRTNIAGDDRDYSISGGGHIPSDYDGIRLEYVDPETNKKNYINKAISDTGTVIDGESFNPKSIKLAGCRNTAQARNRAELEIRKLLYQTDTLSETVLPEGSIYDKGDLLVYAEQYETPLTTDGEIIAINGNVATTTELVTWYPNKAYNVTYTRPDGSVSGPHPISPVAIGPSYKFECNFLQDAFTRDSELGFKTQVGSRYVITSSETYQDSLWVLTEKEGRGRNTQLTMVNYDERTYEAD